MTDEGLEQEEQESPQTTGAGGAAVPPPSSVLAEERAETLEDRELVGGLNPEPSFWPPLTLRDIAYCVGYGVLTKDQANTAALELLRRAGLLPRVEEASRDA